MKNIEIPRFGLLSFSFQDASSCLINQNGEGITNKKKQKDEEENNPMQSHTRISAARLHSQSKYSPTFATA
jgi:hypothetical protein